MHLEIGYALAKKKPIILLLKRGRLFPTLETLASKVIRYRYFKDIKPSLFVKI